MRFRQWTIVCLTLVVPAAGASASTIPLVETCFGAAGDTHLAGAPLAVPGSDALDGSLLVGDSEVLPEALSCFFPCSSCFLGAGVLVVGGTVALATACGAAVATAGGLTMACIGAGVGYVALAGGVMNACAACDACLNPRPPHGGIHAPEGCPPGYHPCCQNTCCKDKGSPLDC